MIMATDIRRGGGQETRGWERKGCRCTYTKRRSTCIMYHKTRRDYFSGNNEGSQPFLSRSVRRNEIFSRRFSLCTYGKQNK